MNWNWSKIKLIVEKEFENRVQSKMFWILALIMPLLPVLAAILTIVITKYDSQPTRLIGIYDESNTVFELLDSNEEIIYESIDEQTYDTVVGKNDFQDFFGVIKISDNVLEKPSADFFLQQTAGNKLIHNIQRSIQQILYNQKISTLGEELNIPDFDKVIQESAIHFVLTEKILGEAQGEVVEKKSGTGQAVPLAFVLCFMMYALVLMSGQLIMQGIIQEKSSRIMEIMVSSIKPIELLTGKFIAYILLSFLQILIWLTLSILLLSILSNAITDNNPIESFLTFDYISLLSTLALFLIYFVFGFLFYASLFAAVGSATDNPEDAGQLAFPVMLPFILSFLLAVSCVQNPHGEVAFWSSLIPITAPICMMVRIPFGVPINEIVISLVLLIVSTILVLWASAKIYRVGVLMYGKKVTFKELLKWIRY